MMPWQQSGERHPTCETSWVSSGATRLLRTAQSKIDGALFKPFLRDRVLGRVADVETHPGHLRVQLGVPLLESVHPRIGVGACGGNEQQPADDVATFKRMDWSCAPVAPSRSRSIVGPSVAAACGFG